MVMSSLLHFASWRGTEGSGSSWPPGKKKTGRPEKAARYASVFQNQLLFPP